MKFKLAGGPGEFTYRFGAGTFLAPKSPHRIEVSMFMSDAHAETFNRSVFYLPIRGEVSHFGQLGEETMVTPAFWRLS